VGNDECPETQASPARRPATVAAGHHVDFGVAQDLELTAGLDPLDHPGTDLPGKGDHGRHERPAIGVLIDLPTSSRSSFG
jgi:hypothetical protein